MERKHGCVAIVVRYTFDFFHNLGPTVTWLWTLLIEIWFT